MEIGFELARYLKDILGWNEPTLKEYWYDGSSHYSIERLIKAKEGKTVMAYPIPGTLEVVDFLWSRGEAYIGYSQRSDGKCSPILIFKDKRRYTPDFYYQTPSQAIEHCLGVYSDVILGKTNLLLP